MTDQSLLVSRHDAVAVITLHRPQVHNALNRETLQALAAAHADLVSDAGIRAIVITGAGERSFCAGADLDELVGLDSASAHHALELGQRVMTQIEHGPVPVIAAVNGVALGGGFELVLASTFSILSTSASLGLPESRLGLLPGYGGTQRLPRVIGGPAAAHVMLTGTRLSAARAYELGLTPLEPVAPQDLLDTALEEAAKIAAGGPRAHALILRALGTTGPSRLDLALETSLAASAVASPEGAEGIRAFRERRSPLFAPPPREGE